MTYTEYFNNVDVKNAEVNKLQKAYQDALKVAKANKNDLGAEIKATQAKLNYLVALEDYYRYVQAASGVVA